MELFIKAAGVALIASILGLALSKQAKDMQVLLIIAGCCMVAGIAVTFLRPVLELLKELQTLGARQVYLMLGFDTIKACTQERYLVNLRLLVHLLQEANPQTTFVVQSVPPGLEGRMGTPTDAQLFRYNLMLVKMCAEYGIPFADVASVLRNEKGHLPAEYCIDPQLYGIHLSDEGCERWLNSLMNSNEDQ